MYTLQIANDPPAISFYESALKAAQDANTPTTAQTKDHITSYNGSNLPITVANWLCNDLFALVNEGADEPDQENDEPSVRNSSVEPTQLGELVAMVDRGELTTPMAKKILALLYKDEMGKSPKETAEKYGFRVISDMDELEALCESVVLDPAHEKELQLYRQGGKLVGKMEKLFMGKTMKASKGNAQPELLAEALSVVLQRHCK